VAKGGFVGWKRREDAPWAVRLQVRGALPGPLSGNGENPCTIVTQTYSVSTRNLSLTQAHCAVHPAARVLTRVELELEEA
jgi:hypothetical protein